MSYNLHNKTNKDIPLGELTNGHLSNREKMEKPKMDTSKIKKEKEKNKNSQFPLLPPKKMTTHDWHEQFGRSLPEDNKEKTDFVLVYEKPNEKQEKNNEAEMGKYARKRFQEAMEAENIIIREEEFGENVFLKLQTPFWRLCQEAARVGLRMPLRVESVLGEDKDYCSCWTSFEKKCLSTEDDVDFVSAPLKVENFKLYKDCDNPDVFFRPSIRSLLTHCILINIDMRVTRKSKSSAENYLYQKYVDEDSTTKEGLSYMLHKEFYSDAFSLHDKAKDDPSVKLEHIKLVGMYGKNVDVENPDPDDDDDDIQANDTRKTLNDAWMKFFRYQPTWMIRDYFGEKIALYFAWCGVLISSLWLPMLFGLAVFIYGLYMNILKRTQTNENQWKNGSTVDKAKSMVEDSIGIVKESFDNDLTPYYALVIAIWGTLFLEFWKRKNATLAYCWDVSSFENSEPDRPQFQGEDREDPVTGEIIKYSPFYKQFVKFSVSVITLIFMVCLVFIVVAGVIVYRVIMTVDYCESMTPTNCLLTTTVVSSVLNSIAIVVLGKIYDLLAVKLTDWENHRTQTEYDDALILKLFGFQFANSYSSLFYIAFFRGNAFQGGLFGLGEKYRDTCGDSGTSSCMPMLSFQILTLMLIKPFPKFAVDVILPGLKYLWRSKIKYRLKSCCCRNQVSADSKPPKMPCFLEREYKKTDPGDYTLSEYTEKVILYGFLMLFAASFPLAPLITLAILLFDIRIDGKRLLWLARRSVAFIAQDVGIWYDILNFINIVGVVTNACLIAFTSTWGSKYDLTGKLFIVIGFEHIVFAIKFIIAVIIPDIPSSVKLAIRRDNYRVEKLMDDFEDKVHHEMAGKGHNQNNSSSGDRKGSDQDNQKEKLKSNSVHSITSNASYASESAAPRKGAGTGLSRGSSDDNSVSFHGEKYPEVPKKLYPDLPGRDSDGLHPDNNELLSRRKTQQHRRGNEDED